ncbi:sulfotransferase [Thermodesulfobacteriota bacterium]
MSKSVNQRHILVTGAHRSGSTFLGRMLSLPRHIGYINEPFNADQGIKGIDTWFLYVREGLESEAAGRALIQSILNGRASYKRLPLWNDLRPIQILAKLLVKSKINLWYRTAQLNPFVTRYLVKDPVACMASEYMHRACDMDVVVLLRHPAAFAGSIKRLNWRYNFNEFYKQKELMRDHLDEVLAGVDPFDRPIIEEAAWLWKCIYHVLFRYLERNPNMIAVRHEDLSLEPGQEFMRLYGQLQIDYTPAIQETISAYTGAANPVDPTNNEIHVLKRDSKGNIKRWKNVLTEEEIAVIKRITGDLASRYYTEEDW